MSQGRIGYHVQTAIVLLLVAFSTSACSTSSGAVPPAQKQRPVRVVAPAKTAVARMKLAAAAGSTPGDILAAIGVAQGGLNAATAATNNLAITSPLAPVQLSIALPAGQLHYYQLAQSNMDPYTTSTNLTMQANIQQWYNRIGTYSPFFDYKLAWAPNAHVYYDSYAIYTNSVSNPAWIMKDVGGHNLYIPWGCSGGICPQYAGDFTNPDFRAYQIQQLTAYVNANGATAGGKLLSYVGIFFDDVNMNITSGDNNGNIVAPKDPATGQAMTQAAWRGYFNAYLNQVRQAFPTKEIVHNAVWFAGPPTDPQIAQQIKASDWFFLERGFGDSGLSGGTGQWSLYSLMNWIDQLHAAGGHFIAGDYYLVDQLYALSCYFLVENPQDFWGDFEQTPANWPTSLYGVQLGLPQGARYKWNNLWRRDYFRGMVLVNEPGASSVTVPLPAGSKTPQGTPVTSATLAAKQGGIYLTH